MADAFKSHLVVEFRSAFGVTRAYPSNPQATKLAYLVGSKTLTARTLENAIDMGFDIFDERNPGQRMTTLQIRATITD